MTVSIYCQKPVSLPKIEPRALNTPVRVFVPSKEGTVADIPNGFDQLANWFASHNASANPMSVIGAWTPSNAMVNWSRAFLRQISEFKSLSQGWDGLSAMPPNSVSRYWACAAIESLREIGLRPDSVGPSVEGGVGLVFAKGTRSAVIELHNDGDFLTLTANGSGVPDVAVAPCSQDDLTNAIQRLRGFLEHSTESFEGQRSVAG